MLSAVIDPGWLQVDELVEAFERAWTETAVPEIRDFLPPNHHPHFRETLLELIRVDLELRWKAGCPVCLDEYRLKFPEALARPESFSLVAYEEFRAKRNAGEVVSPVDYEQRFGILTDQWPTLPTINPDRCLQGNASISRPNSGRQGFAVSESESFPEVGTKILTFHLQSEIGRGAFSRVYLARQIDLADRLVVLKISAESFAEADKIAQLQHANIVPIYSIHQLGRFSVVCMPYFGATTLADVSKEIRGLQSPPQSGRVIVQILKDCERRRKLASIHEFDTGRERVSGHDERLKAISDLSFVEAVLWIGAKLADGLNHAHQRGILHRDLKPANVVLADDGRPMLLDFNLSRDLKQTSRGRELLVGGTLPYMAPEQIDAFQHRKRNDDVRSDVYSLGVILFELLTGRNPYPADDSSTLEATLVRMAQDRQRPCPKFRDCHPGVTPAVQAMIQRCLHPKSAQRYQCAADLQEDLGRHLKQLPLRHAHEPSVRERTGKWIRRNSRFTSMIAIAAVVIGGLVSVDSYQKYQRVRAVETEVNHLMERGRLALDQNDANVAHGRFLSAWMKVQAEPKLVNYQLGVAGWLEHSRMAVAQEQWRRRSPPREFDDRRDEALLLSVLLDPSNRETYATARGAILAAGKLTISGDAGWARERELLALVETDLIELETGTEQALRHLDSSQEFSSMQWQRKRAALLNRLGRVGDAERARSMADAYPPDKTLDDYLTGMELLRRHEFNPAVGKFDAVLIHQPEKFAARLFQALCFLNLNRPGEARVALTACIAQRPLFLWSYLFRSEASLAVQDEKAAIDDLQYVLELNPSDMLRGRTLALKQAIHPQPE